MKLVARCLAAAMLFGLAGCDGLDLKLPFPSIGDLSDLTILAEKKPTWQSPLLQRHHLVGRIWRPADGRFVDEEVLLEDLVRSAFILLGEKHDNPDHHLLQARLIRALIDRGRRPAVVWEMIPATRQPVLDRFHANYSRDGGALGAALDWDVSGWPAWRLYQPIAEAAMAGNLAMFAAGLPKSLVRALARDRPSLKFTKRRRILGLNNPLPKVLRARSIEQLFQGHCGLMPRDKLIPLFNVQRARDAVFAEHMLSNGIGGGAILIAGDGHVRTDLGVPLFLARHQPGVRVTTVGFVEVLDEALDPIEYGELFSAPVLPFDYVWFTPRADDKDQCAKLRKKWGKPEKSQAKDAMPKKKPAPKTELKPPPKAEKAKPAIPRQENAKPEAAKSEAAKSESRAEKPTAPKPAMTEPEEMGGEGSDTDTMSSDKPGSDGPKSGEVKIGKPRKLKRPEAPMPPLPRAKPPKPKA
ncbi:MAG: ChaN family lipoprotein [Alphaproteobacteria bacterium]